MTKKEGSPSGKLAASDLKKMGKSAFIAASGGALAALGDWAGLNLTEETLGLYYGIAAPAFAWLVNTLMQWLRNTEKVVVD